MLIQVKPLDIKDFKLLGRKIETVDERLTFIEYIKSATKLNEIKKVKTDYVSDKSYAKFDSAVSTVKEDEGHFKKESKLTKKTLEKKKRGKGQTAIQF